MGQPCNPPKAPPMRFLLIDDDGQPFRRFWTRAEAEAYLLEHWTIRELPKDPKPVPSPYQDALACVGASPF